MGRAGSAGQRRRTGAMSVAELDSNWKVEQVLAGLEAFRDDRRAREERLERARRTWCAGRPSVPAPMAWPEDSLGDRFVTGVVLARAVQAPSLAAVRVPDPRIVAAEPAHWTLAVFVLVRAVVLDGVALVDPKITALLRALGPLAAAELGGGRSAATDSGYGGIRRTAMMPGFFDDEGPLFILGCCALLDAIGTVIAEDPLEDILDVLGDHLDTAVPGTGGRIIAESLVSAYAFHHRYEMLEDADVLDHQGRPSSGDPLADLVASGVLPADDALRAGLAVLRALGELCLSTSVSVLGQAAYI